MPSLTGYLIIFMPFAADENYIPGLGQAHDKTNRLSPGGDHIIGPKMLLEHGFGPHTGYGQVAQTCLDLS